MVERPWDAQIPTEARRVILGLASAWADVVDCRALEVSQMKGAMTNQVYEVKWPTAGSFRRVLLRIYDKGVEVFFHRDNEIRTFECMWQLGRGPRLLARFTNGRVEEFLHARDYEYGSYNPIAFDLATHFNEMTADYDSEKPHILDFHKYPDYVERKRFVQIYLSSTGVSEDGYPGDSSGQGFGEDGV